MRSPFGKNPRDWVSRHSPPPFNQNAAKRQLDVEQPDKVSGPSQQKLSKAEAQARYEKAATSKFCAPWSDLTKAEKRKWRDPLYNPKVF